MADETGQVDCSFDTGVTTADYRNRLALEQGTVAVRAIGHTLAAIFLFTRHVEFAPACAGRDDDGLALQLGAVGQLDFDHVARNQFFHALCIHDIDLIAAHMLFQCCDQLWPFGFLDRDEVLDSVGIHHLAAETFSHDAGADALARSIDRRRGTGRTAAHHQHVERCAGIQLPSLARRSTGVELGKDFFHCHAALAEMLAIHENGRHRHDLLLGDFILIQRTVDHDVRDVGVDNRHQVERLHDFRAILAGQRDVGLEMIFARQIADLLDDVLTGLGRMAANLQNGKHQRSEFVAHGNTGELHSDITAWAVQLERGTTLCRITLFSQADIAGNTSEVLQQLQHFARLV